MKSGLTVLFIISFFSLAYPRHLNYSSSWQSPFFDNKITNMNIDLTDFQGAYTVNGSIYVNTAISGKIMGKKIAGGLNMELSWSPDGKWILFTRASEGEVIEINPPSPRSMSYICIIHPDGTGLKVLTAGKFTDYCPTWSRDGSNFIIFNRFDSAGWRWYIYRTAINAKPGEEKLISDPAHNETGFTCLRDGRMIIFSDRNAENIYAYIFSSSPEKDGYYHPPYMFVLTPDPGRTGKYEQLRFQYKLGFFPFHMTLSRDETRLAYETDYSYQVRPFFNWQYWRVSIAAAEIDISNLTVSNENLVSSARTYWDESPNYPSFTGENDGLIYFVQKYEKNCELFYYDFKTKKRERISTPSGGDYSYYCDEASPK
jgi:dipeptidyl aminopeptidase/acylaminoacyl peptidase